MTEDATVDRMERKDLEKWRLRDELRRGSRSQPHKSKKAYKRKPKHKGKQYD